MKLIANKNKWASITEITKRSVKAGLFVNTPCTKVEFYKDGDRECVNITNWNTENECHVYYKLDYSKTLNLIFVEMKDARTGELLQSNTFETMKTLKEYLKTV